MGTRDRIEGCVSHRLDEVDGLIRASAAGGLPQGPIWVGHPFLAAMADGQFRSATQSGAVSLLPSQEQAGYATIYAEFDQYHQAELVEQVAWGGLRTLEKHPVSPPILYWQLRSAIQIARRARWEMETAEDAARTVVANFGIQPITTIRFTLEVACIPINTERTEAERKVVQGGFSGVNFDWP